MNDNRNALSVDERFEAAKRRNNYLREKPAEAPRREGWKVRPKPMGGLKPHGLSLTFKREL
jgi:hypothetical protein